MSKYDNLAHLLFVSLQTAYRNQEPNFPQLAQSKLDYLWDTMNADPKMTESLRDAVIERFQTRLEMFNE